jgi:hypothetical protein
LPEPTAPPPLFFKGAGCACFPLPFPQRGNGAHPVSGLHETGHFPVRKSGKPDLRWAPGVCETPLAKPLRSGRRAPCEGARPFCESGLRPPGAPSCETRCRRPAAFPGAPHHSRRSMTPEESFVEYNPIRDGCQFLSAVMRGLDPRIHDESPHRKAYRLNHLIMDCRVKPGNDRSEECNSPSR